MNLLLGNSLEWESLDTIADLNVVSCLNSNSSSELILFSEWLSDTLVVIRWSLSVLHELDGSWKHGGTSLGSIVHHGKLSLGRGVLE